MHSAWKRDMQRALIRTFRSVLWETNHLFQDVLNCFPRETADHRELRYKMIITHSAAETRDLGARLADQLKPGDVVLLEGDLGAGKSELARGIARGLGVQETVTSPSFTILNVYESGLVPLYHFDWYRLESSEELYELGMDEYLGGNGIALVEWPERCPDAVPEDCLRIRIRAEGEETRRIEEESSGCFRTMILE